MGKKELKNGHNMTIMRVGQALHTKGGHTIKKPLHLTIDEDLIEFLKDYAAQRRMTVSHIINQYAATLKQKQSETRGDNDNTRRKRK